MSALKNKFWIRGNVTEIILNSPKFGRMVTFISTENLEMVQSYEGTWYANWSPITKSFYCAGRVILPNGKISVMYLHRWVTKCPKDMVVDHFNNNTLDNLDSNLRVTTRSGNQQNRGRNQKNNTSGMRGVSQDKQSGKWVAHLGVNGTKLRLGLYKSKEEAEQAVKRGRAKHMPFSKEASLKMSRP
ncbi:HNH endonuclease [Paenibacillus wynnii]|nr:HNH endonuclease [Paenibacillus wynnii]